MNFKRNYVTILLLTTLFIFLSCSDDNSNIDALQNGNKEEALLREKLGLPKQNLTLEEIEKIKKM